MNSRRRSVTIRHSKRYSNSSARLSTAAMRPVDKGVPPAVYATYQDAGSDLRSRLGDYCSYCERQIETHLAVEHVQPKVRRASLRNVWSNVLLGCVHCNSRK